MASGAKKGTQLVVGLVVAGLVGALLVPVAIGPIAGPEETTATLNTTESVELQPELTATLDSVDTAATPSTATFTVNASGTTQTVTVDNGTNTTVTVDGTDVNIAVTDVGTDSATADFESPTTYAWDNGAAAMWGILPVIIVLALFLFVVGLALSRADF